VPQRKSLRAFAIRCRALLRPAAVALLVTGLGACASLRSYNAEMSHAIDLAQTGAIDRAVNSFKKGGQNGDTLYHLERGELLRLAGRVEESQREWFEADKSVQKWEDTARLHPQRLVGDIGSVLVNDRMRPYDGSDFEKVMLTARMALNHIALGQWDQARVAIKRTHEREALIAELRAKQTAEAEEKARKQGAKSNFKELNGYPVSSIDSPEVNQLKNSYQSAFSHYLAGFIYEALDEPSLAAAGYRQAIELQPGTALLEQSLAGLDARVLDRSQDRTDVLVVVERGTAPARVSQTFNLPIFSAHGMAIAPISMPVLHEAYPLPMESELSLDSQSEGELSMITSIDLMSRRQLQDEMPWIMLRAAARATAKVVMQQQAMRQDDSGLLGALAILATVVTEQADERSWRTLPATISVARLSVTPGSHTVGVTVGTARHELPVNVEGRYALVCIRILGSQAYLIHPAGQQMRAKAGQAGLG
jgi:uncharacterized protein